MLFVLMNTLFTSFAQNSIYCSSLFSPLNEGLKLSQPLLSHANKRKAHFCFNKKRIASAKRVSIYRPALNQLPVLFC